MASAPQDFPVSVQAMISLSKRIPLPLAPIVEVDAWIGNWYLIHNPPLVKRADIPKTFHLTGKQLRESSTEELAIHFEDFVLTMTKDMAIKLANDISDLKEENFNGLRKREMLRLQPMLVRNENILRELAYERRSASWSNKAIVEDLLVYQSSHLALQIPRTFLEEIVQSLKPFPTYFRTTINVSNLSTDRKDSEHGIEQDHGIIQRLKTAVISQAQKFFESIGTAAFWIIIALSWLVAVLQGIYHALKAVLAKAIEKVSHLLLFIAFFVCVPLLWLGESAIYAFQTMGTILTFTSQRASQIVIFAAAIDWIIVTTKRFQKTLLALLQIFLVVFLIGRPLYYEYKEHDFSTINLSLALYKDDWVRVSIIIAALPLVLPAVAIVVLQIMVYCVQMENAQLNKRIALAEEKVELREKEIKMLKAIQGHIVRGEIPAAKALRATLPKQNIQFDLMEWIRRQRIQLIIGLAISLISTVIMEFSIIIHIQEHGLTPTPVSLGVLFHGMMVAYLYYAYGKAKLLEKRIEEHSKHMELAKANWEATWAAHVERERKEHDARQRRLAVARQRSASILEGRTEKFTDEK